MAICNQKQDGSKNISSDKRVQLGKRELEVDSNKEVENESKAEKSPS